MIDTQISHSVRPTAAASLCLPHSSFPSVLLPPLPPSAQHRAIVGGEVRGEALFA